MEQKLKISFSFLLLLALPLFSHGQNIGGDSTVTNSKGVFLQYKAIAFKLLSPTEAYKKYYKDTTAQIYADSATGDLMFMKMGVSTDISSGGGGGSVNFPQALNNYNTTSLPAQWYDSSGDWVVINPTEISTHDTVGNRAELDPALVLVVSATGGYSYIEASPTGGLIVADDYSNTYNGTIAFDNPMSADNTFTHFDYSGVEQTYATWQDVFPADAFNITVDYQTGLYVFPNQTTGTPLSNSYSLEFGIDTTGAGGTAIVTQSNLNDTAAALRLSTPQLNDARITAQSSAQTIGSVTVGAADATYVVSANVDVTASTAYSFTVTCTYTNESNSTVVLTEAFTQITGSTLLTAITNATGVGSYEGLQFHIRAKAATSITWATTGTFTTVTYNAEGIINRN